MFSPIRSDGEPAYLGCMRENLTIATALADLPGIGGLNLWTTLLGLAVLAGIIWLTVRLLKDRRQRQRIEAENRAWEKEQDDEAYRLWSDKSK